MTTFIESLRDIFDPFSYELRVLKRLDQIEYLEQLYQDRVTLQAYGFDEAAMELYQARLLGIEQRCSNLEHI